MERRLWAWVSGAALAMLALAGDVAWSDKASQEVPKGFEMSVGVTLNTLTVAVLDGHNHYRTDLKQTDFQLLLDGKLQEIAEFSKTDDEPLDLAILLDVSGSMRFSGKFDRARWVIKELLGRIRPDEAAALMIFADSRIEIAVPYTTDRKKYFEVLDGLKAFGKTALSDALAEGADLVVQHDSLSPALILLTDGFENASKLTLGETLTRLRWRGVPVYPLAVVAEHMAQEVKTPDTGSDFEMLRTIAGETGGSPFVVASTEGMVAAVTGILQDLRSRYRLGFYAPDSGSNARAVSVNMVRKDYKVRYRRGFKP
jgi:Ca-activated chloride channel homolog